ncbi:TIGR03571 family LLM class oxidoreductase [Marinitenerispora sediminis]|uniref:LLM class flavin-dependent oxidoreductase n=1 Tax=Marinitenerispora sediminis TaxID=1931232 RepID=A0A368TBI6_9ACTN|nr:TIGR03571 family LLM class oxidoreductase [Marinitenerispora sediminis]RCV50096.1 LLM class flavin-dependent oxidoreductase [Marinitenerispora sediminis]RCV54465.1 LLM class flavin-dependent oxidoreductase [Marinitenerispora sediminis]RCV62478.1 LLM class flavin-dependent oxidoreductase [Marinitenerispora sediminis]
MDAYGRTRRPFAAHPGMVRAFPEGRLTLGLIAPLESFRGKAPTLERHLELAGAAERAGFASLWLRDVPFLVPHQGDAGQVLDPWVYLGALSTVTSRISLGTAAVVLPVRHPAHVAKAAASVDHLSGGRMLLGVAGGDRPDELRAFGLPTGDREAVGERIRQSWEYVRQAGRTPSAPIDSPFGAVSGRMDLLPKPVHDRLPMLMTGRGGQSVEWIAEHADGWLFFTVPVEQQALNVRRWRRLTEGAAGGRFRPFAQGMALDLSEDPVAPSRALGHGGHSMGREPLLDLLEELEAIGVNQLMLNLRLSRRPMADMLEELARYVLPAFPAGEPG